MCSNGATDLPDCSFDRLCTAHESRSNSVSRNMVAILTCRVPIRIHSGIECVLHHHVATVSINLPSIARGVKLTMNPVYLHAFSSKNCDFRNGYNRLRPKHPATATGQGHSALSLQIHIPPCQCLSDCHAQCRLR